MKNLVSIRRVTLIAAPALESTLVRECKQLGAPGYICVHCRGKSPQKFVEGIDPFVDELPFVRIEMLVGPGVADKIVEHLSEQMLNGRAHTVCVETVEAATGSSFLGGME